MIISLRMESVNVCSCRDLSYSWLCFDGMLFVLYDTSSAPERRSRSTFQLVNITTQHYLVPFKIAMQKIHVESWQIKTGT